MHESKQTNSQWRQKSHPEGNPKESDFEFVQGLPLPKLGPRQFLVRITAVTVDPYMRGLMNRVSYRGPSTFVGGEKAFGGEAVGVVVESQNEGFAVGDFVQGPFGWQAVGLSDGERVKKITHSLKPTYALGAAGMPGTTAYLGFFDILEPKAGETIFVSGAAGAVGSLVGQLAKLAGCRVIGSVGGSDKVKHALKLGFDAAIDYKGKDSEALVAEIKKVAPDGIDAYFDNTGGPVTEAVFSLLNVRGRVSVCGQIAHYNQEGPVLSPSFLIPALWKQLTIKGFIVSLTWTESQRNDAVKHLVNLISSGKLHVEETVTKGLENTVKAFIGLFSGHNTGKAVVEL